MVNTRQPGRELLSAQGQELLAGLAGVEFEPERVLALSVVVAGTSIRPTWWRRR